MKEKKSRDPAFGERLTNLLKEKGIKNNNRFALAINKAPIVTLGWLNGKIPAYPDDWRLLCEFFNVSADFLLIGKEREKEEAPAFLKREAEAEERKEEVIQASTGVWT